MVNPLLEIWFLIHISSILSKFISYILALRLLTFALTYLGAKWFIISSSPKIAGELMTARLIVLVWGR